MVDAGGLSLEGLDLEKLSAGLEGASQPKGPSGSGAGNAGRGSDGGSTGHGAKGGFPPIQSMDFILDIPLKITVELGRSKMMIRDVLQLAQGSVVELAKFAGEPLEVLVNEKLIARGEVVVVNEKFGIRLTDIISPVERIEQLK